MKNIAADFHNRFVRRLFFIGICIATFPGLILMGSLSLSVPQAAFQSFSQVDPDEFGPATSADVRNYQPFIQIGLFLPAFLIFVFICSVIFLLILTLRSSSVPTTSGRIHVDASIRKGSFQLSYPVNEKEMTEERIIEIQRICEDHGLGFDKNQLVTTATSEELYLRSLLFQKAVARIEKEY